MTNIANITVPAYNIAKGRDFHTGRPLHFDEVRKSFKKLLIETVKVAAGIGGFFAVSTLMKRQTSLISAAALGTVAVGGALVLTSQTSSLLYDATKITAGLLFFQKGFVDFLLNPAIQSVKAAFGSLSHLALPSLRSLPFSTVKNIASAYLTAGKGYLRVVGGMISLGGALKLTTSGSEKVPVVENFDNDDEITPRNRRMTMIERPQRHLIDRGIIRMVKGTAYLLTRMRGYSIPNRRDYQIDRIDSSFALQEETPRPASPSRSLAEPAATS